jgi:RHS repeat-associated protein
MKPTIEDGRYAIVSDSYDVMGAIGSRTGSSSKYRGFAGEQRDEESGYYYLRERYFDPVIGRFLGQDPLGGGYPYAGNNPINLTDPTGLYMIACDDGDETTACIDSVDVGLPAEPPSSCDTGANNVCVWDSGFTAPYESNRPSCLDSGCTATTKNTPVRSKESPKVDDEKPPTVRKPLPGGGGGGGSWGSRESESEVSCPAKTLVGLPCKDLTSCIRQISEAVSLGALVTRVIPRSVLESFPGQVLRGIDDGVSGSQIAFECGSGWE